MNDNVIELETKVDLDEGGDLPTRDEYKGAWTEMKKAQIALARAIVAAEDYRLSKAANPEDLSCYPKDEEWSRLISEALRLHSLYEEEKAAWNEVARRVPATMDPGTLSAKAAE